MTTSFALFTMYRFGYDASHNGYLFMYVGIIGAIIQGGLIGRLVKMFGEMTLVMVGALLFTLSLFAIPLIGQGAGLPLLLLVGGTFALGNSLATPSLQTLASRSVGRGEQGGVLGVVQSVASLARAVGPSIAALLISSAVATYGADGRLHEMSDHSLRITFWTAAAIMLLAFLLATYFARAHANAYAHTEIPTPAES
jgi:DHA1 family tetracycline resistance protein-like MFS transporter